MKNCLRTGMPLFKRGKVRDIYDLGDHLLIVGFGLDCALPAGEFSPRFEGSVIGVRSLRPLFFIGLASARRMPD